MKDAGGILNWVSDNRGGWLIPLSFPFLFEAGFSAPDAAAHAEIFDDLLRLPATH